MRGMNAEQHKPRKATTMKQQKTIDALDASNIQPVCPVALAQWERHVDKVKAVLAANQDCNQCVQIEWLNGEWLMKCQYTHLCDLLEVPSTGSRIIHTIRQACFSADTKVSAMLAAASQMQAECRAEAIICVKAIAAAHAATV